MAADFSSHMFDGLTLEVGPGGSVRVVTDDDARKEAGHYVLEDLQSLPDVDYTKRPTRRGSSATARKSNSSAAALGFRQGTAPAAPDPEKLIRGRIHDPLYQIVLGTPWSWQDMEYSRIFVALPFGISVIAAISLAVELVLYAHNPQSTSGPIASASVALLGFGLFLLAMSGAKRSLRKRLHLRICIVFALAFFITVISAVILH